MHTNIKLFSPIWLTCFLFFLLATPTLRAGDVLEHCISVHFEQEPLQSALVEIARQGGFE